MTFIDDRKGVSLIEVLAAVAIVVIAVAILSPLFPKISQDITSGHQKIVATTLALSKIEDYKKQAYLYITPLAAGVACDCAAQAVTAWPSIETFNTAGTIFSRYSCANYVNPTWTATCGPDPGYMNVRVQVAWKVGTSDYQVKQEALVTRY